MLKPTKKLISLVRATVKPQYIDTILDDAFHCIDQYCSVQSLFALHGISFSIWIDESLFEGYNPNDWKEYPKHKPIKNGIYRIRYENGGEYLRRWKDGRWYDLSGEIRSNVFYKNSIEFKWFGEEI